MIRSQEFEKTEHHYDACVYPQGGCICNDIDDVSPLRRALIKEYGLPHYRQCGYPYGKGKCICGDIDE